MQQQFDSELSTVKEKYEAAVEKVEEASRTLQELFKRKVRNIKEKSALFFAKIEMKMKENNQEVLTISKAQRDYLENVAGPTQRFDAQICTLKNIVGC